MRAIDTVCRLGGDEFVLLFEDFENVCDLRRPLDRIIDAMARPFEIESHHIQVSTSIGVTVYPLDNVDTDTLLRHADQAMYMAKQAGRNQAIWFDVNHERHVQESHRIIADVRQAFERGQLELYYQPKVNMRTGHIHGMEALLRWNDPNRGVVSPGEFLPQVEHSSLIVDIGEWVIESAIRQALVWDKAGFPWAISVNIAARHIQMLDFVSQLKRSLEAFPALPQHRIEIEILESVALNDVEQTRHLILEVQKLGVDFSLDDFGTGYSSLKYLKRLPVNFLKIDQTFVRDLLVDKDDRAVVDAVIGLASAFNRRVIAEGVETTEHMKVLLEMGCEFGQGYGIARPMPAEAVLAWAEHFAI
jgi:EAL domain-containing protein (putative c-di-GMP-specific phosphodiesterase class I)